MFNVAVFRLRDLVKYIIGITIVVAMLIFVKRYFYNLNIKKVDIGKKLSSNVSEYIKKSINLEIPEVDELQNDKNLENLDVESKNNDTKKKIFNTILGLELSAINIQDKLENIEVANEEVIQDSDKKENENSKEKNEDEKNENVELAKTGLNTEVITKNPLQEKYTKKYRGVKIKNETDFDLTDEVLNGDNLKIDKSNIIIFHTHTCESYTSSEKYSYEPTGKYRTTDLKYSVARVGDELTKYLKKYNMNVVHDKTYHDYPAYSGSYSRSLKTVSKLLKTTKADIIIDLHRDAIGSNSSYAPTVKIGDDECAQIMFVMGTNGGGLTHPDWQTNLKFAVKIQEIANKQYKGLFKPIILRNSRYNQNLGKAACIIEVGATGNTLEQCLNSMKYLAEVINEF